MQILYFAWVREQVGAAEEQVSPGPDVTNVGELLEWLRARGGGFASALEDRTRIRVAVNQQHVGEDHVVTTGDEIAIFPPVTGG